MSMMDGQLLEVLVGLRGNELLIYQGHQYSKKCVSPNSIRWVCVSRSKCKGALTTAKEYPFSQVSNVCPHTHPPDELIIEAVKLRLALRKKAIIRSEQSKTIVESILDKTTEELRQRLGKSSSIQRDIRRKLQSSSNSGRNQKEVNSGIAAKLDAQFLFVSTLQSDREDKSQPRGTYCSRCCTNICSCITDTAASEDVESYTWKEEVDPLSYQYPLEVQNEKISQNENFNSPLSEETKILFKNNAACSIINSSKQCCQNTERNTLRERNVTPPGLLSMDNSTMISNRGINEQNPVKQLINETRKPAKCDATGNDLTKLNDLVNRLEEVSTKLELIKYEDSLDQFGRYLTSLLRGLPLKKIQTLQNKFVKEVYLAKKQGDLGNNTIENNSITTTTHRRGVYYQPLVPETQNKRKYEELEKSTTVTSTCMNQQSDESPYNSTIKRKKKVSNYTKPILNSSTKTPWTGNESINVMKGDKATYYFISDKNPAPIASLCTPTDEKIYSDCSLANICDFSVAAKNISLTEEMHSEIEIEVKDELPEFCVDITSPEIEKPAKRTDVPCVQQSAPPPLTSSNITH
uniref:FLYWCH-type domain-containing protein n=2 Tax=Graphocephala atropunctata TaxID=36148 RepID=A0A1B6MPQ8_9HEMI